MQCVHSVLGMLTLLTLHAMLGEPSSDRRSGLACPPRATLGKLAAEARVLGWIQQRLDLGRSEAGTHVRVLCQQLAERPSLRHGPLGCVVHGVMRALAPDLFTQLKHESFGHNQPARKVEI